MKMAKEVKELKKEFGLSGDVLSALVRLLEERVVLICEEWEKRIDIKKPLQAMNILGGDKMEIRFKIREEKDYTLIHFELEDNVTPGILKKVKPPKVDSTKGVVLSGRGPIWLYCYLTHHYHPTKFIATYDPRVGGAIVVESHEQGLRVGEIIKVDKDEL